MSIRKIDGVVIDADTVDGVEGTWTDERLRKGAGVGVAPDEIAVPVSAQEYALGDVLIASADVLNINALTAYTKIKEVVIEHGGSFRIKFSARGYGGSNFCYARIYKNGVGIGTEREMAPNDYTLYSEDISGWSPGDLVQLYSKKGADNTDCKTKEFRMYADRQLVLEVKLDD